MDPAGYDLGSAMNAHDAVETGAANGKVVVDVARNVMA
jgi:hypothetical protein